VSCCFAVQDKVWVDDPDGSPWEIYTVLSDIEAEPEDATAGVCCGAPVESTATTCC